jgi:hypothetical protein
MGERVFVPTPNVPSSPRNPAKPEQPWYKTFKGWKPKLEAAKIILELIAIPFAVGYAVITYNQWQDLRREQRAWIKSQISLPEPSRKMRWPM